MSKYTLIFAVIAGLVLAMAPAAAMAAATWNGSVNDNWSNMGNWTGDPTAGGNLTLLAATTTTVDTNTSLWGINEVYVQGGTLNVVAGGTLAASRLKPSGGNVIQTGGVVDLSDRIHSLSGGTVEISGGSWDSQRWTYNYGGTLHIIGGTGVGGTGPTLVKNSQYDDNGYDYTQWFTLDAGGVTTHTSGSGTISASKTTTIKVDGIQDYLDGSGSVGDVLTLIDHGTGLANWTDNAEVDDDPVGSGLVDGGKGLVTITTTGATLTIVPEPATMTLLAIGGLGVLLMRRRRRRS